MKIVVNIVLCFFLCFSMNAQDSFEMPEDDYIVLKNVSIIDAIGYEDKQGTIVIKNQIIESVNYDDYFMAPKGATVIDMEGLYVMPGIIDAHVHITHGTLKDAQRQLEIALRNGVTGIRDMGGDGRMLALLQRNMKIGEDIGPDVFYGSIIAGPSFFIDDPRPQQVAKGAIAGEVPWQRAITNESDLKEVIAEIKGIGATAIKVYLNIDKDLFKRAAAEAKRQGLKVWAHAVVPPTKAIDITNGGADVMSHAGSMVKYEFVKGDLKGRHDFDGVEQAQLYRKMIRDISWEKDSPEVQRLFTAMKNNNSILDATLFVYHFRITDLATLKYYEDNNIPINKEALENAMKATKVAHEYGVKIGAGSDHMISERGEMSVNIHKEMELLVEAGLSNVDAIKAATIINAEGMGQEQNIGTIEKGKLANLVVLYENPLEDITNTKKIKLVIKRGKIFKN